jgi:hypothetical protein
MQTSGAVRGEKADVWLVIENESQLSQRHCERSEAIHATEQRKNGLLRFARNDG